MVFIIIVTYYPDTTNLQRIINSVNAAKCVPIIVDNSEEDKGLHCLNSCGCITIRLGENKGIAAAQNIGVKSAINHGAKIIGFFDQDSIVDSNIITNILDEMNKMSLNIAAPVSIDKVTGVEYSNQVMNRIGFPRNKKKCMNEEISYVNIVISSGTFICTEVFKKIGFFDESLFIDFVDIEFCMRCYEKKIPIAIVNSVKMYHSIGKCFKKVGIKQINVHSPYRTYYKVRNAFLLINKNIPLLFCLSQIGPAIINNFPLIFDKKDGKEYKKYYFNAIIDGIKRRGGKYEKWHKK